MHVAFLGTSGAVPTPERNPSSLHVSHGDSHLLFDVGENTQRQLARFDASTDISALWLTHTHGDHVLGLPGLLYGLHHDGRTTPLPVYTPRGTESTVRELVGVVDRGPRYDVEVESVTAGETIRTDAWTVETFETAHRTRALGYAITPSNHDSRVVYTGDTRPTETTVTAAREADLLVHDAMFDVDNADRAEETGHSTAAEAGAVASGADVTELALTHISPRHAGEEDLLYRQARDAFDGELVLPDDGDTVGIDGSDTR